ncbi:MAG TPA: tetratricopeptide repeat protein [Rhodanobacteraceae bacterium]|nr:tetratricopeptide repeat protein [Rhodanobacteraceae bacterium]
MALEDYDEHEQSERVLQWLRENAAAIAGGIVLGLLLIFGLQQWRTHQAQHRADASGLYQQLQQADATKDQKAIDSLTMQLQDKYKDTPFAVFSAFDQARRALAAGKPEQAVTALNWAEAHAGDAALKSLAQLRIATAQLAAGKADASLATLAKLPATDYSGMAQELRGDALVKLKRNAEALKAYTTALASYDVGMPQRNLLQLKIDNLTTAEQKS